MKPTIKHTYSDHAHEACRLIAHATTTLARKGFAEGTSGNISMRGVDFIAITPSGASLDHISPDHIALVALDGTPLRCEYTPSSELTMHLEIYRQTAARAIVHTHSPMATAASCVLAELPAIHYNMLDLGGSVNVAPYHTFGSTELAHAVVSSLDKKYAVLLANHGAVTVADTLEKAIDRAELLEWACTLFHNACAMGTPRILSPQELDEVRKKIESTEYGILHRQDEV